MVVLKIIDVGAYNKYELMDMKTNKSYSLFLEFYGINKPDYFDEIAMSEDLLDPNYEEYCQPYAFKLCEEKQSMPKNSPEFIALKSHNKKYILKRIYG